MSTPERIVVQPEPDEVTRALDDAPEGPGRTDALRAVVTRWPTCLEGWARLADGSYDSGDDVSAYAFARVGYHRGLDRLRAAGWRGSGTVAWDDPPNRGFLHSLWGLMRASAAIGEGSEARRCREFLLELDPSDHYGVAGIRPADLSRRLDDRRSP